MSLEANVLTVVDPTSKSHPVIDRLVNIGNSERGRAVTNATLMFAVDPAQTSTRADNPAIYVDVSELQGIADRLKNVGMKPEICISWSHDWADSILFNAEKQDVTAIILSHPGEDAFETSSDEFWHLLRNSPVPIGIIRGESSPVPKKILVAVDIQDDSLNELNRRILETGKRVAAHHGAELHLANAYRSSDHYPDRGRIVRATGLPNENIHLVAGSPDEGLREITRNIVKPDMVIVGVTRRTGIRAALRGRKLAQIFKTIKHDIFVVV